MSFKNFTLSSMLVFLSLHANAEILTVIIKDVANDKGRIIAVLCKSGETFPGDCHLKETINAKKDTTQIKFPIVKKGEYAFAAYHDQNKNGKLDIGDPSVPNESLVFSNDSMGEFGPPTYEQAAFTLEGNMTLVLKMVHIGN